MAVAVNLTQRWNTCSHDRPSLRRRPFWTPRHRQPPRRARKDRAPPRPPSGACAAGRRGPTPRWPGNLPHPVRPASWRPMHSLAPLPAKPARPRPEPHPARRRAFPGPTQPRPGLTPRPCPSCGCPRPIPWRRGPDASKGRCWWSSPSDPTAACRNRESSRPPRRGSSTRRCCERSYSGDSPPGSRAGSPSVGGRARPYASPFPPDRPSGPGTHPGLPPATAQPLRRRVPGDGPAFMPRGRPPLPAPPAPAAARSARGQPGPGHPPHWPGRGGPGTARR